MKKETNKTPKKKSAFPSEEARKKALREFGQFVGQSPGARGIAQEFGLAV